MIFVSIKQHHKHVSDAIVNRFIIIVLIIVIMYMYFNNRYMK